MHKAYGKRSAQLLTMKTGPEQSQFLVETDLPTLKNGKLSMLIYWRVTISMGFSWKFRDFLVGGLEHEFYFSICWE